MSVPFCMEFLGPRKRKGERTTIHSRRQTESRHSKIFGGHGVISSHFLLQGFGYISLNRVGLGFSVSTMQ